MKDPKHFSNFEKWWKQITIETTLKKCYFFSSASGHSRKQAWEASSAALVSPAHLKKPIKHNACWPFLTMSINHFFCFFERRHVNTKTSEMIGHPTIRNKPLLVPTLCGCPCLTRTPKRSPCCGLLLLRLYNLLAPPPATCIAMATSQSIGISYRRKNDLVPTPPSWRVNIWWSN